MAKRWKVVVTEAPEYPAHRNGRDYIIIGPPIEVFSQSLDTLDLEELILFVNGMQGAVKR